MPSDGMSRSVTDAYREGWDRTFRLPDYRTCERCQNPGPIAGMEERPDGRFVHAGECPRYVVAMLGRCPYGGPDTPSSCRLPAGHDGFHERRTKP